MRVMRKDYEQINGVEFILRASLDPIASAKNERNLIKKAQAGDRSAKNFLILSNLRLVHRFVNRKFYLNSRLEQENLFVYGIEGLMAGIENFDLSKKVRLSTYAPYHIEERINSSIENYEHLIRKPLKTMTLLRRLRKILASQKTADTKKIANILNISEKKLSYIMHASSIAISSFDIPATKEENGRYRCHIIDFIPGEYQSPEEMIIKKKNKEDISRILRKKLAPRELFILTHRFGLDGDKPRTLKEIGKTLNITQERVRQLEIKILEKIKKHLQPFK